MKTINNNKRFFCVLLVIISNIFIIAQEPCLIGISKLNQGYTLYGGSEGSGGNWDEFGIVDTEPFFVKVGIYPPVQALPITLNCGTTYYISFDTDGDNSPIPYNVAKSVLTSVKTFRENGSGFGVNVKPPKGDGIDATSPPDFLMKFNGTKHQTAWSTTDFPWENFVSQPLAINSPFSVTIQGPTTSSYNQALEVIADVNGGKGIYKFEWSYKERLSNVWSSPQNVQTKEPYKYFLISNQKYFVYNDEYKYQINMPANDIEINVTVWSYPGDIISHIPEDEVSATFIVSPNPLSVRFLNLIDTTENYGKLILDEDKMNPINSGDSKPLAMRSNHTIRTKELPFIYDTQNFIKTERHQLWDLNTLLYSLNYNFEVNPQLLTDVKAKFNSTDPVAVKNILEGSSVSGGEVSFKDPWLYYEDPITNNWYQSNELKQYPSPLEIQNNSANSYGGVFLNQNSTFDPTVPNYSVQATSPYPITLSGKTHTFYFQNWTANPIGSAEFQAANALTTGVVFKSADAAVNANYKGHLVSNSATASTSNSQRKVVCDRNGIYHMVYQSQNTLYYTKSVTTNFDGEWTPDEELIDLGSDVILANPSIDINTTMSGPYPDDKLSIVFEASSGADAAIYTVIKNISGGTVTKLGINPISIDPAYFGNAKPVVASFGNEVAVVYKSSATSPLYLLRFYLDGSSWTRADSIQQITNTDANSINPAVASSNKYQLNNRVQIAWQQGTTLRYQYSYINSANISSVRLFTAYNSNVTFGSGNTYNSNPSIIDLNGGARLVWWGIRKLSPTLYQYRTSFKDPSVNGGFWHFGSNVYSPVINKMNDNSAYILAWSQDEGSTSYFTDNSLSQIHDLNINGKDMQLSNGSAFNTMHAISFTNTALPYYFAQSNDIQSLYSISKTNLTGINKGREGVVAKGSGEIYFTVGDVSVNGENISFKALPDSFTVSTVADINEYVRTIPFLLTDNSEFYYSVQYGITDSVEVMNSFSASDAVSFRVELVDAATEEVLGVFDNVSYTKQQLVPYDNFSYQVSPEGIGNKTVYMRLVTVATEGYSFSLGNVLDNQNIIAKKNTKQLSLKSAAVITEYALAQNYPNPFNPTTTISYQLPKSGYVTLKIFDMLGNEVKTLVNEQKEKGRYTAQFDASSLASGMSSKGGYASGVYVYQIKANDYVATKKMMLLK